MSLGAQQPLNGAGKCGCISTMEYDSAIKNEIMPFAGK
jgi:hypothetical protein